MSYPNSIKQFVTKIDKNASGWNVGPEYFNVPATTPFYLYLDHIPKDSATTVIGASGGATWTEVSAEPVGASQYLIDYDYGKVTFSSSNAGAAVQAVYKNLGDDIMAEHVNTLQGEVVLIEETIGTGILAGNSTLDERLVNLEFDLETQINASGINGSRITDNTIRAGALKSDIKGPTWISIGSPTLSDNWQTIYDHKFVDPDAHAAELISANPAGTCTFSDVQGHIYSVGDGLANDKNPHGVSWVDIYNSYNNADLASLDIIAGSIAGNSVYASGNIMPGTINPVTTGPTYASGVYDVGSASHPFASGAFNSLYSKEYKTGASVGVNGSFTTNDGKTVIVKSGLIVSIL